MRRQAAVYTVHEVQGNNFDHVNIVIMTNADKMVFAREKYLYTAITRHRYTLAVYGDDVLAEKFLNIQDSFNVMLSNVNGDCVESVSIEEARLATTITTSLPGPIRTETVHAEEIIDNVIPKVNEENIAKVSLLSYETPCDEKATMRTTIDQLAPYVLNASGLSIGRRPHGMNYLSADVATTTSTLIARYLAKTKVMSTTQSAQFQDLMWRGWTIKYGINEHERLAALHIDRDRVMYHTSEYFASLQHKKLTDDMLEKYYNDYRSLDHHEFLDHFMKNQVKYKASVGWDTNNKAGQGVSAWDKFTNIMYAGWHRAMQERSLQMLAASNIIIATGCSDADLSKRVADILGKYDDDDLHRLKKLDNDLSECDASMHKGIVQFENTLHEYAGMPLILRAHYATHRAKWTQVARTKAGTTRVQGNDKQHSGQTATLLFNTEDCSCLTLGMLDIDGLTMALFKGDDSSIWARDIRIRPEAFQLAQAAGHKFKLVWSDTPEFAGFFINKHGFYPDVIKKVARLLTKKIVDRAYFDELILNVAADTEVVFTGEQAIAGAYSVARHYTDAGLPISVASVEYLFDYLRSFRNASFDHLQYTGPKYAQLQHDHRPIVYADAAAVCHV